MTTARSIPNVDVAALFEQAVEMYETAAKAGLEAQEEAVKCFTEAVEQTGTPQEWQERMQEAVKSVFPTVQQNIDETLAAINRNVESNMAILQKAFEAGVPATPDEVRANTRELWEASLALMRENAQATVQLNARMLDAWGKLAKQAAPQQTEQG